MIAALLRDSYYETLKYIGGYDKSMGKSACVENVCTLPLDTRQSSTCTNWVRDYYAIEIILTDHNDVRSGRRGMVGKQHA